MFTERFRRKYTHLSHNSPFNFALTTSHDLEFALLANYFKYTPYLSTPLFIYFVYLSPPSHVRRDQLAI